MYLIKKTKESCCGCGACEAICPTKAIELIEDFEGFYYPKINNDICINCKRCEKVCSFNNNISQKPYIIYGGWSKNKKMRDASSSGGIFFSFAKYIIENGGVVFGAAYDDNFNVKHICVDNLNDLSRVQKSKYVQSDTEGVYETVKHYLDRNIKVLFSGTPCQVEALVSFLGKKERNLFLCEVICFGVPSPKVYKKYLEYNENKYKSKIVSINFKDKRYGWDYYTTMLSFANGKSMCLFGGDSYKKLMQQGLSIRPSCFNCKFDINNSCADISLGDFYNFNKYVKNNPPKNGVSCILVRTEIAKEILNNISEEVILFDIDYDIFHKNEIKSKKTLNTLERKEFFNFINANEYKKYISRFNNKGFINFIKHKLLAVRKRLF